MSDDGSKKNLKPGPLEGVKIVEYGVFHAGPGGGAILGDLGADIIKVEAETGDPERNWCIIGNLDMTAPNGESIMYEVSNRNKKNICLDIKSEKGRKVFNRLVEDADVFLTNLRTSTKTKLGVDYESIRAVNPKIIHANVTGFGPNGPLNDIGAFDPLGQACSGMMFVTGTEFPATLHLGILDQATAISLSHAVITALFARERQGVGQEVHVSLYGTALWLQHPNLMLSNALSVNPCVTEDRSKHSPLRNAYCCKDGRWVLGTHHPEEKYWGTFCKVTGKTELLDNPGYTDSSGRPINYPELTVIFEPVFLSKTRDEWMDIFRENFLMFCPVQKIDDVERDPQAQLNNYVVPCDYPGLGKINMPGYPIHFSENRAGTRTRAPKKGEHSHKILKDLGYNDQRIQNLEEEGVIHS